jgi:hypothetical protein
MASKIDTGIVQTVKVTLPRPGPAIKGRGRVELRQGTIAVHAGDSVDAVVAFADAIRESWEKHSRNWSLGEPTGLAGKADSWVNDSPDYGTWLRP